MKNQQLHDALKEYCETAVSFIRANVKSKDDLPSSPVPEIEFAGSGYTVISSMKIDWMLLGVIYENALKQLPVYPKAVETLEADEMVARHLNALSGTSIAVRQLDADTCIRSLLTDLMRKTETTKEDIFDKIYDRFEDYFYRNILLFRYLVPLYNFKMEPEKVELAPGFSIVKLSQEERASMLRSVYTLDVLGSLISYEGVESSKYALEFYHEEPKVIGRRPEINPAQSSYNVVMQNIETACTALRLYKSGNVGYQHVIQKSMFWNPLGDAMYSPRLNVPFLVGRNYELTIDEVPNFLDFWKQFKQAQIKENALKTSLRRFTFVYERGRAEDRLIDYIIALEALLLENEPELRLKLSLRGAALLDNNDPQTRKKVFHELHEGYKQRNNIAHGEIPKQSVTVGSETLQLTQLIDRIGNYVRETIRAFILLNKSKKQILAMLDQKIIEGFSSGNKE